MATATLAVLTLLFTLAGFAVLWRGFRSLQSGAMDRACPLCGYDMTRVPGRQCTECSFAATGTNDLYPGGTGWGRVALGVLLLTPLTIAVWHEMVTNPTEATNLWDVRWVIRGIAMLLGVGVAIALVRTLVRDFLLTRRKLPPKRGRAGKLLLASILLAHAVFLWFVPRGGLGGWKSVPPARLVQAGEWVWQNMRQRRP